MPVSDDVAQPSWGEIFRVAIDRQVRRIWTSLPGKIVSYDATTQRATVQLSVQEPTTDGAETIQELQDCPVQHPHGSNYFVHVPLTAGDEVYVHFAKWDPSAARVKGEVSPPAQLRPHGLNAFAVPFRWSDLTPISSVSANELVIGQDGGPVLHIDGNHVKLGDASPDDFAARADRVEAAIQDLADTIGGLTPVANDGGATIITAMSTYTAPATACDKVKAS